MDTTRTDALAEKIFGAIIGSQEIAGLYLGEKLGLYVALREGGPATSVGLAERTGLDERYLRE